MGARTNFSFKTDGQAINLYSHWGGESAYQDLANALAKAEPRWNDISYGIRIAISQIIGNNWDSETGYGLMVNSFGEESYDTLTVDFANDNVSTEDKSWSLEGFVKAFG